LFFSSAHLAEASDDFDGAGDDDVRIWSGEAASIAIGDGIGDWNGDSMSFSPFVEFELNLNLLSYSDCKFPRF
jgi:hypothetical protein